MAKLELLSRTIYDADGVQTNWDFNFASGYLLPEHVKAYYELAGVRTQVTPAMLVGPNQLRISPAVPAGAVLTIYRDTPKNAPLVDFVDRGTVSEVALDTIAKQAVFTAAESSDSAATASTDVAVNAAASAQSAALATSVNAASAAASALAAAASAAGAASAATDAVNLHKADLLSGGADLNGYSAGAGAPLGTIGEYLRAGSVTPWSYLTAADRLLAMGSYDATYAVQLAFNSGKAVDLGDSRYVYRVDGTVTKTGQLVLVGQGATVRTNGQWLEVTDGTDSILHGFQVLPITTPYTIKRNTSTWSNVVGDVVQSLEGYIPSPLDSDLWGSISPAIKTANSPILPTIYFKVSSAAGASGVSITGIKGRQLCVVLEGYTDSTIHHNDFGGGQKTYGCVVVVNGINRAYNSALLGFTLPRGKNNSVSHNTLRYATLNGICWFGNDEYQCIGNDIKLCGESGIKTYQYDGAAGPSETLACISTTGRISGNSVSGCFYDGVDAQVLYGVAYQSVYVGTYIGGNTCQNNRHTGVTALGEGFNVSSNVCTTNGTYGVSVRGHGNLCATNRVRNNATTGTALVGQPFDMQVQGDDCVSYGNLVSNPIAVATWNYLHSGLGGIDPTAGKEGLDFANYCVEGVSRFTVSPTIGSFIGRNGKPVQVGTSAYTVTSTDYQLDFFTSAACVVTLPSASNNSGRTLRFRNTNTFAINSASANVQQISGGAPTTSILANVAGKWCELTSDGTNWKIYSSN